VRYERGGLVAALEDGRVSLWREGDGALHPALYLDEAELRWLAFTAGPALMAGARQGHLPGAGRG